MSLDRRRGVIDSADDVPPWCAADMDAWAEWVKRFRVGPGSGGGSTIWWMMQAFQLGIWSHDTSIEPEMPANLAAVDNGVARLEPRERKAFCAYYLQYARAKDKAKHCRCDEREFYRRVKRARRKVAEFCANAGN